MVDAVNKVQSTQSTQTTTTNKGVQSNVKEEVFTSDAKQNDGKGTSVERTETAAQQEKKEDLNLVKPTQHKVNRGFYPATSDQNPKITGKDGILANNGEKITNSKDPAGTVAEAVISTKSSTAQNAQMHNQIRQMIIKANPSVFEQDGSLKKNADLGKLDIPAMSHLLANVTNADPKRTVIPKGFYPAFQDKHSNINGLTEHTLRQNEKGGNQECGAVQVLNALLTTKTIGNNVNKAALLNDLVRKNPSVFTANGQLKPNADLSKLDVPTLEYMRNKYQVPNSIAIQTTIGNNGYYVQGTGAAAKFYKANGQEVAADEFAKHCPTIYKNVVGSKG